jgi:hypothetical protein
VNRHYILRIFLITFGTLAATNSRYIQSKPEVDMSSADAVLQKAGAIGSDIENALAVAAGPIVDRAE